jgi:chromate transporter
MHRDLVEKQGWIFGERIRMGQPWHNSLLARWQRNLVFYLGYVHYGILGASLCGFAFVLPSFFLVVAIRIGYRMFGSLLWMPSIFYGVGAAVVCIIAISTYKLT